MLNNLTLDFDNDYIEIFISILSKIKNLDNLVLGSFVNKDVIKIISLYCKRISNFCLWSNLINDDHMKEILLNCRELTTLDIRGCDYIQGSCFIEIEELPQNLKKIKTTISNFNCYNLMEFLKTKGIEAQNYYY
jgi:hypothetical protein